MLNYTIMFLVIALLAGILGFWAIAGTAAFVAKILFVVFLDLSRFVDHRKTQPFVISTKPGAIVETIVRRAIAVQGKITPVAGLLNIVGPLKIECGRHLGQAERGKRNKQFDLTAHALIMNFDWCFPMIFSRHVSFHRRRFGFHGSSVRHEVVTQPTRLGT